MRYLFLAVVILSFSGCVEPTTEAQSLDHSDIQAAVAWNLSEKITDDPDGEKHKREECPTGGWIDQGDGHSSRCPSCDPPWPPEQMLTLSSMPRDKCKCGFACKCISGKTWCGDPKCHAAPKPKDPPKPKVSSDGSPEGYHYETVKKCDGIRCWFERKLVKDQPALINGKNPGKVTADGSPIVLLEKDENGNWPRVISWQGATFFLWTDGKYRPVQEPVAETTYTEVYHHTTYHAPRRKIFRWRR